MSLHPTAPTRPGGKLRLLLADDHPSILQETKDLLASDFDIVGTAADGNSLLAAARTLLPDVVVTDIKMPHLDGIEASRCLMQQNLCRAVIVLSVYAEHQIIELALDAGVRGYVLKQRAGEDLVEAIRSAFAGSIFLSPAVDEPLSKEREQNTESEN